MKLFEIDSTTAQVAINKAWIVLIPEFKVLYTRDKTPITGGQRIRKRAIKEFTFIYFMADFSSPLRDWEPSERRKEALLYATLTEEDIDKPIDLAIKKYEELILACTRSLRTYKALLKLQDATDAYFESIDFTELTKQGELKHDLSKIRTSVKGLDEMYDAIAKFEKRVEKDLEGNATGIRGTAVKGEMEDKVNSWSEADIASGSSKVSGGNSSRTMVDLMKEVQSHSGKPVREVEMELDAEEEKEYKDF
jgi:hypothetical protein